MTTINWLDYDHRLRSLCASQCGRLLELEDLVQSVYVRLLTYPPRQEVRDPAAWLCMVAWRTISLARRRERRRADLFPERYDLSETETLDEFRGVPFSYFSVETHALASEAFHEALAHLHPNALYAIIRTRCEGASYEEVGAELKLSPHTVHKHCSNANAEFAVRQRAAPARRQYCRKTLQWIYK